MYGQYLAAQRWRLVLAVGSMPVSRLTALRLNLVGTFVGNFLPGQGGGDIVKATFLFSTFPEHKPALMASVVYDRILGLLAILALAGIGALSVGNETGDWHLAALVGWGILCLTCLFFVLWLTRNLLSFGGLLKTWFGRKLGSFTDAFLCFSMSHALLIRCLALSLAFQLLWAVSVWLMMRAVSDAVPFVFVLLAAPISVLVAAVPISLGGLGVREGVIALVLSQFGVETAVATAGAILSLAPILLASLLGAILMLLKTNKIYP